MLAGLFALALVLMKSFPETPFAGLLHRALVEWPIEAAERMERRHIFLIGVILFCGPSLAAFGSAEVAMLYAVDLSLYAEAVMMTSLSAAAVSFKKGWGAVAGVVTRALHLGHPRQRSRRVRVPRSRLGTPSNDDEPAWSHRAA
jgi:hypothetical protein